MSDRYFIEDERIYLRKLNVEDVNDNYYQWMNDPEVTGYLESRFFPSSLENIIDYVTEKKGDKSSVLFAIVLKEDDRHIGNIKIGPINWIHRLADIGLMIGEKDCWGKGYATEAIRAISSYGLKVLNLHKITASCYGSNVGSEKAFLKVGFEVEGKRKEHFFSNGKYEDQVLLGLINSGE